jgi:hypothetical protein
MEGGAFPQELDSSVGVTSLSIQGVLFAVTVLVVLVLALVVALNRRSERHRARLDRDPLVQLRRIYRRDNPRGTGLDPMIQDQQRPNFKTGPRDG